jgi:hypothetical protein
MQAAAATDALVGVPRPGGEAVAHAETIGEQIGVRVEVQDADLALAVAAGQPTE